MSKPLLSKSRFENLLWAVRPPECQLKYVPNYVDAFALSDEQMKQLEEALWMVFRHRTGSLTEEDNALLAAHSRDEFITINEATQYKWY